MRELIERNPLVWTDFAKCSDGDPDAMFVKGAEQNIAKRTCRHCLGRIACMIKALDTRAEFGVWGGMTERERRALLRKYPHIVSWADALQLQLLQEQKDRQAAVDAARLALRVAHSQPATEAAPIPTTGATSLVEPTVAVA